MKEVIYKKENQRIPIKSWVSNIEMGALDQAKNLANLPFLYKHVALMPDCHQGFGMPIGGVIATKGVVIPNAVGCFTGDTKIPLLKGTQKTLKELQEVGGSFYVYSLDKDQKLVPGKATAKLTRKNAILIEVIISGGEIIRCTPDHKFMLLDGSYKKAKDLQKFDSLMPLYRSYQSRDGYERIRTKSGNGVITHKMVTEYFFGKREENKVIHHKDENWFNNSPENLIYKNVKLHSKEHRKNNPIFGTEKFKEKRLRKLQEKGFYDKKFKEKKRRIAIENINKYNKSDKKKEQDKLAGRRGAKYLIKYNSSKKENNHKVLDVNFLTYKEDVYCLTVEKYHNFALSSGVFVHNCDIGCGMCAVKTSLKAEELKIEMLKEIMGEIRNDIPLGFNHHKKAQDERLMPPIYRNISSKKEFKNKYPIVSQEYSNALTQLGTLGGGNHFIEIQKDEDDFVWIMIHSGSRNIGNKVAQHYNKLAKKLNSQWSSGVPQSWDLAFFPIGTKETEDYMNEMNFCLDFAYANRLLMMNRVKDIFIKTIEKYYGKFKQHPKHYFDEIINIHHNYATFENHFGENVVVHRKGATRARKGEVGIIPGSQGTCSYIVEGLGNPESFESCSHGAGRKMGRKDAQRRLDFEEEKKKLDDMGVVHSIRSVRDLDEAPGSYKDIDEVMNNQKDLVKIITKLTPLGVVKG